MPYISQVAAGVLPHVTVFGNDYPTLDGTCMRDYLHVVDLAKGHCAALRVLETPRVSYYNLGTVCARENAWAYCKAASLKAALDV